MTLAAVAFVGPERGVLRAHRVGARPGSPIVTVVAIAQVAYFALLEGGAAVGFAAAARERAGASRSRLAIAAIATGCSALALVDAPRSGLARGTRLGGRRRRRRRFARVVALLSALGYLAAFAPPRRICGGSASSRSSTATSATSTRCRRARRWSTSGSCSSGLPPGASGATARRGRDVDRHACRRRPAATHRRPVQFAALAGRAASSWTCRANALFLDDDLELVALLLDRARPRRRSARSSWSSGSA